ncbi:D-alanine--D-alanine ligase family protein [Humidesulfovibrio sp.]
MNIGLVFDPRPEQPDSGQCGHAQAVAEAVEALRLGLEVLGFEVDAVGSAKSLATALGKGQRWDLAFCIATGGTGTGREALVPALLDAHGVPYVFSDPLVMALCQSRPVCKRLVRDLGLPTPDFVLLRSEKDAAGLPLPYPVYAKPTDRGAARGLGRSAGRGARAADRKELAALCRALQKRLKEPVLVEEFLPGREFTVGVIGSGELARPLGVMETAGAGWQVAEGHRAAEYSAEGGLAAFQGNDLLDESANAPLNDSAAQEAVRLALDVWRGLGGRDAGLVRVRQNATGQACFLEASPLPGLHPQRSDLPRLCAMHGASYQDLLGMIVQSALERLPVDPNRERA